MIVLEPSQNKHVPARVIISVRRRCTRSQIRDTEVESTCDLSGTSTCRNRNRA